MTEELDEIYRRASALDPSRPSESVRRKVLEHAAALAARPRPAANRPRWRPAIFGTLAAAGLAGLLIVPRVFNPHPPANSADTAVPAQIPPDADAPPGAGAPAMAGAPPTAAGAPPFADAPSMNSAPAPFRPPQGAAKFRAIAPADRQAAAPQEEVGNTTASAQPASPQTEPSAALRRAAETGDVQALRVILGAEVPIDAPDARGRTALMLAASGGRA